MGFFDWLDKATNQMDESNLSEKERRHREAHRSSGGRKKKLDAKDPAKPAKKWW